MKAPSACQGKEEIRKEIDSIDQEILKLLAQRFEYVKEIVKYKVPTIEGIVEEDRYNKVISSRMLEAEKLGMNPQVIGDIYTLLLKYFIQEELKAIKQ